MISWALTATFWLLLVGGFAGFLLGCGLVARLVRRPSVDARCAFEWGCTVGPLGILLMAADRLRYSATQRRQGHQTLDVEYPPSTADVRGRSAALPSLLAFVGAGLSMVSLVVPWVSGRGLSDTFAFVPVRSGSVIVPVVLLGATTLVGILRFRLLGRAAILGIAAGMWTVASLLVWLVAGRVAVILPTDWLPDESVIRVGFGATLALWAGPMMLSGVVADLVTRTWRTDLEVHISWTQPVCWTLAFITLSIRHLPWMVIRTDQGGEWSLPIDVLPGIGDALAFGSVVLAVGLIALGLASHRAVRALVVLTGILLFAGGFLAVLIPSRAEDALEAVLDRLPGGPYLAVNIETGASGYALAGVAFVAVIVAVARRERKTTEVTAVVAVPATSRAAPPSPF